jgi:hypothetical protein
LKEGNPENNQKTAATTASTTSTNKKPYNTLPQKKKKTTSLFGKANKKCKSRCVKAAQYLKSRSISRHMRVLSIGNLACLLVPNLLFDFKKEKKGL